MDKGNIKKNYKVGSVEEGGERGSTEKMLIE